GRAYKITSNSWEYTGDGHSLAYEAGADLIDMEFIQFHPTGMVWPPSVMGILVTEGVRGEGGILTNKEGRRFMFDEIPENYRSQTADNEEEGWRYCQGDKNARRPPELLTRDHIARCIVREIKEGRGSPHGGVYLDIAWIKQKLPDAAGINGANRLGGNSLSDLLVFGKRAGEFAARFAKGNSLGKIDNGTIDTVAQDALAPFESRGRGSENPYEIQGDLQELMQDNVGIVRTESEMQLAL